MQKETAVSEFDHPHRQLIRSLPKTVMDEGPWHSAAYSRPEENQKVLVWDSYNRLLWIAEWDQHSGYFFGELLEMQSQPPSVENPGRIYGAHFWYLIPENLQHLVA